MRPRRLSVISISLLFLNGCGDQDSAQFKEELVEESSNGLGLYALHLDEGWAQVRFFDGRFETVPVETSSALAMEASAKDVAFAGFRQGGQVVLRDWHQSERRSQLKVFPVSISVAPDRNRFAFVGLPRTTWDEEEGLFIGDFEHLTVDRLSPYVPTRDVMNDPRATLSWSPSGTQLLYSNDGKIALFDLVQHSSRTLVDGWSAQWSPSGAWISYVDAEKQGRLLNLSTGEGRTIRAGHKMLGTPLEWSPNGEYLLLPERKSLPSVNCGHLVVYRVADGAAVFIERFGIAGWTAHWFKSA